MTKTKMMTNEKRGTLAFFHKNVKIFTLKKDKF